MNFVGKFIFLSLLAFSASQSGPTHNKKVICYVRPNGRLDDPVFDIEKADLNVCTHVIVVDTCEIRETDRDQVNGCKKLTNFLSRYPHLKARLEVEFDLKDLSNSNKRRDFISESLDTAKQNNFYGINLYIDLFEERHLEKRRFNNFVSFVNDLKNELDKSNLLLSMNIDISNDVDISSCDFSSLSEAFDFIYYSYSFNDWNPLLENTLRINNMINWRGLSTFESKLNEIVSLNVPREKIVMDLTFSGVIFKKTSRNDNDSNALNDEVLHYKEICRRLKDGSIVDEKSYESNFAKLRLNPTRFIFYENSRSVANKVRFGIKENIGGFAAYIWTDDYLGDCKIEEDRFDDFKPKEGIVLNFPNRTELSLPLFRTINEAIVLTLDEIRQTNDESN